MAGGRNGHHEYLKHQVMAPYSLYLGARTQEPKANILIYLDFWGISGPMNSSGPVLAAKLRGAALQLKFLPRTLRLVWAAARGWTAVWLALLLAQGLLPVALVYLTRDLVDALAPRSWPEPPTTSHRDRDRRAHGSGAAARGGLARRRRLGARGAGAPRRGLRERLIHAQSTRVDLAFYESPEYHDHLHRARAEATYRPVALLENGGNLVQNGITLAAMAAVLLRPLRTVAAARALREHAAPRWWWWLRFALRQHRWRQAVTADERRAAY
jgi:ATP-binding cassette subfamily B protein